MTTGEDKKTKGNAPTEEQILKELKRREQRKAYQQSDVAKTNRKKYMQKRYDESKAMRDYFKNNPDAVKAVAAKHGVTTDVK